MSSNIYFIRVNTVYKLKNDSVLPIYLTKLSFVGIYVVTISTYVGGENSPTPME